MKLLFTKHNIDTSHFTGQGHSKGKKFDGSHMYRQSNEELFVENSSTQRSVVRRRVLKHKLLPYECHECGVSEWRGKKLSLNLDHINGKHNDHRLENLRFVCPNCDSVSKYYCGRNKTKA